MGYLASVNEISFEHLKKAMIYGTLMASFNIEDFSLERFKRLDNQEISARYEEFHRFFSL